MDNAGNVYAWGANEFGQLGNGNAPNSSSLPILVQGLLIGKNITYISAGQYHSMAVDSSGNVYTWGNNNFGQLGNGTIVDSHIPILVQGLLVGKVIIKVAGGYFYSLALSNTGQVYSWGANNTGQLGDGTTTNRLLPVAVNTSGVLNGKIVVQIAAGNNQSLAVDTNGQTYSWGNNAVGQLGNGTTITSLVPVTVNTSGVLNGKTIIQVSAGVGDLGNSQSLAVDNMGQSYAWGFNDFGQLGNGSTSNSLLPIDDNVNGIVKQVAAGTNFSLALYQITINRNDENRQC